MRRSDTLMALIQSTIRCIAAPQADPDLFRQPRVQSRRGRALVCDVEYSRQLLGHGACSCAPGDMGGRCKILTGMSLPQGTRAQALTRGHAVALSICVEASGPSKASGRCGASGYHSNHLSASHCLSALCQLNNAKYVAPSKCRRGA